MICDNASWNKNSSYRAAGADVVWSPFYLFGWGASQVGLVVKNLLPNAGNVRDTFPIPMLARSPGGGHGNPLQYSCLENPMDRGAWRATVPGAAESQKWLKLLSMHTHTTHLRSSACSEKVRLLCEISWTIPLYLYYHRMFWINCKQIKSHILPFTGTKMYTG